MSVERRQSFLIDREKFATQRNVTYYLLLVFAGVTVAVFWPGGDQSERSTMMQTVINFTMLALGYWLGSSKGSIDKDASISRIAEASAPTAAAAVAAASAPIKTDEVKIDAQTATVTTEGVK